MAVLEVFKRLGQLKVEAHLDGYQRVVKLMGDSTQPVHDKWRTLFKPGTKYCEVMQSHHNLEEVFELLWSDGLAPKGSFEDLVFRLVAFH